MSLFPSPQIIDNIPLCSRILVAHFEGYSPTPYLCPAGIWTIGYGCTTLADGTPVSPNTPPLSRDEADTLLQHVITRFQHQLFDCISVPLENCQAIALISFTYNVGLGQFLTSTLRRMLNRGEYGLAADQFLRWNHVNGAIMAGLRHRRQIERMVFLGQEVRL